MAPFKGFIGGSYQAAARQGDQERSLNFYPEQIQSPGGKTKADYVLLSRPGLAVFTQFAGASSVRAECELNGRAFAIAQNGPANAFYEVLSNGTSVSYGALPGDRRPQLTPSETEVLVLCGGIGYVFNLAANTLTRIDTEATAPAFPIGATKSGFLDGYGIVLEPNSQTFAISGLNDFTAWDGLDFGDAEGEPGNVVTFIVDHRQVWFFCNNHTEVYYDAGTATFPLVRLDGAFMEQGADSIDGAFQCDNTVFWLGGNRDGRGICWRANGYTPERVSTHAIEALIQSFGDPSDVSGYAYQETGHTFARWDFPSANGGLGASLLFDVASGFWHERCFWNATLGVEMADLARSHMFAFGKHLVGDWRSGTIYEQSMSYTSDAGAQIRRLRAAPDLAKGGKYTKYGELRLLCDVGVGLDGAGVAVAAAGAAALGLGAWTALETAGGPPNRGWTVYTPGTDTFTLADFQSDYINSSEIDDGHYQFAYLVAPSNANITLSGQINAIGNQNGYFGVGLMARNDLTQTGTYVNCYQMGNGGTAALGAYSQTRAVAGTDSSVPALIGVLPLGTYFQLSYNAAAGTVAVAHSVDGLAWVAAGVMAFVPSGANFYLGLFAQNNFYTGNAGPGVVAHAAYAAGVSIPAGGAPATNTGVDPQIVLQTSDDGGRTWSSERSASLGKLGDYQHLVRWRRNGRSNNRAFRVICTEAVRVALVACDLDSE